jgi:hypothetical protein
MLTRTASLLIGAVVAAHLMVGAPPAFAQGDRSAEAVDKAIKDLEEIERELGRVGESAIGGHRDKAINLVREAQRELKLGRQYAAGRGSMREGGVDINNSTWAQLQVLPGINEEAAKKIAAGAPYAKKEDLVRRKVLTQDQYDKIKDRIVATPKK